MGKNKLIYLKTYAKPVATKNQNEILEERRKKRKEKIASAKNKIKKFKN